MKIASTNFADLSHFMVGSDTLKLTPFYLKNFTIPGISMVHPSLPTKSGINLKLGADNLEFESLELEVLLDSNFETYFELMTLAISEVNFDSDYFTTPTFDLWVKVLSQQQNELFRFEFTNCRIAGIGSLSLEPESELGATITVSVVYDYFRLLRPHCPSMKDTNEKIKFGAYG